MTTLTRYEGLDELLGRIETVRLRYWTLRLAAAALAVVASGSTGLLLAAATLGYWPGQPPAVLRWGFLGVVALAGGVALAVLFRRLLWRRNPAQMARFIERHVPEIHNDLINSILLARDSDPASPELVQAAIREAVRRCRRVDLRKSLSANAVRRWGLAAGASLGLLAAFALFQPAALARGLVGLRPSAYVPGINALELVRLEPGDAKVLAGEPVTVLAEVRNPEVRILDARLVIEGRPEPLAMVPDRGYSVFTQPLDAVEDTLRYRVEIGDSRWPVDKPWYTLEAVKRIAVRGLDLHYEFPPYTGIEANTVVDAPGPIEAPLGSRVRLTLRLAEPVDRVLLETGRGAAEAGRLVEPMQALPGNREFRSQVVVDANAEYRLMLQDARGRTFQQVPALADADSSVSTEFGPAARARLRGRYPITAIPDRPPVVRFLAPNRDVQVAPGGTLETVLEVADDYGLADVALLMGKEGETARVLHAFDPPENGKGRLTHRIRLNGDFAEGDVLVYYARATDGRKLKGVGGPQTQTSSRFKILVQDPAKVAAEKARRYEELRRRLLELLKLQETQRVNAGICRTSHPRLIRAIAAGQDIGEKAETMRRYARDVLDGQKAVRAGLVDLAEGFPFDPEMIELHQVVAMLAANDERTAVDQAEGVVRLLEDWEHRDKPHVVLIATQERILDTLRQLLALMPAYAGKGAGPRRAAFGDDLPPDARERLAGLKHDLTEFVDAQKKIIEASKRLAKTPVDNFTAEDEKLLKDLQAAQDKWEKFLNEQFTDFSKLLQQDFSNPAVMKELISVKSDITMAKDALKKKAQEIATACEDNAIENAKSLTANIEKWLPDEPDRTKWDMEDPTGEMQDNAEQPELPTELEDLVGDLLEEEEDLFDEMQDLSSKYAMSGDKGIGWDAMDGPISNMNAQGVTGNQLPNANELQGRSGEGRQGKSSGEFVENKAIGKGGRRTPTRLTPEPFQKGQVDDQSKEPAGGVSGGGKVSGAGEEGLEGPVPPELQKEMPRLAGKQAQLLNRAERIREKFRQSNYAHFKLLQAITLMNRVQSQLRNYRYQNVLRQRDVTIGALRDTKFYLGKGIDVVRDASEQMPKYIRDDIDSARDGRLPEAYREVLKQYYRRLSEQAGR